ncbi:hypothetical protein ACX80S_16820 [Arthrobacter sp. RHLT1-20]
MYLQLASPLWGTEACTLMESGDFTKFHVSVPADAPHELLPSCLQSTGAGHPVDPEHVAVSVKWLRDNAPVEPVWEAGFEAMISYAATKGWVSDDGTTLTAHVQRGP